MIAAKDFRIFSLLLEPALTSKLVTLWGWGIKKSLGIFSPQAQYQLPNRTCASGLSRSNMSKNDRSLLRLLQLTLETFVNH
jgi:hypothetical protein